LFAAAEEDLSIKPAAGEKHLDAAAADKLLLSLSEHFKTQSSIKAKIVTETEDWEGKRKQEGELLLDRPNRVMRKFTKPNLTIFVLNESYVQDYSQKRKTLLTKECSKAPKLLSLFQAAVTLDFKILSTLFTFTIFESEKEGIKSYRFVLIPRKDSKQSIPYKLIQARIVDKALFFHEIEYQPDSGDISVEKYSDIQAVPKPKEDAFVFEVPHDAKRKVEVMTDEPTKNKNEK
jgi:outer membrane lipoprotein-sorting protein